MKYCGNCGSSVTEKAQFCGECGANTEEATNPTPKKDLQNPLKKMTKKQKIFASIAASVLIMLFIGYKVGANMTSTDKAIEAFEEAVVQEDAEKLSKWLYSSDERLEINQETATYFINYVKKHPSYLDHVTEQFEEQAEALNASKNEAKAGDLDDYFSRDSALTLKTTGKTALVFNKHRFEVKPYYINIHTNYPGSKVYLNGEEAFEFGEGEETKEYGPVLPGEYQIENVYEGEYTTLKTAETINLLDSNHSPSVRLRLDGHYIDVRSNYDDAELLVNGEVTGKTVQETEHIGPLPSDGTIKLQTKKTFPWGDVTSESVTVGEDNYYNVDLSPVTDQLQQKIFDIVESHNKQWIEASKNQDFSKYTHINSELASRYKEDVDSLKENKVLYYGEGIKKIEYDLNSFDLDTDRSGNYVVNLKVLAAHHGDWITTDADEETKKEIDAKTEMEEYEKHYELQYNDQNEKWIIVESRDLSSFWERLSDNREKRTF